VISRTRVVLAVLALAGAVAAAVVVPREVVYRAESGSMSPAVAAGDVIVAARSDGSVPERGAIVVFSDPGGWSERSARLTGRDAVASTFVKRVVGLPGERVVCCDEDGRVQVDGTALAEPYRDEPDGLASILAFDVTVPPDAVFVLGDARDASIDSRYLGPVPLSSLIGVEQLVLRLP
jgi:signal peptidase I